MGKLEYKKILFFEDINKNKFYVCKKRNGHDFLKVKESNSTKWDIVNGDHSDLIKYMQNKRGELTKIKKLFFSKWCTMDIA